MTRCRFPGAAVNEAFGWTSAHPVGDAYRAFKSMPYDAPTYDLAAMHYTANPESGLFQVSEPGTLSVSDSGATTFAAEAAPCAGSRPTPRSGWRRSRPSWKL